MKTFHHLVNYLQTRFDQSSNLCPSGGPQRGRVHGGGPPGGRGSPPPGAAHARRPAHLLGSALEPGGVDEVVAAAQPPVSHVQLQASAAAGARLRRRLHPAGAARRPLSAHLRTARAEREFLLGGFTLAACCHQFTLDASTSKPFQTNRYICDNPPQKTMRKIISSILSSVCCGDRKSAIQNTVDQVDFQIKIQCAGFRFNVWL